MPDSRVINGTRPKELHWANVERDHSIIVIQARLMRKDSGSGKLLPAVWGQICFGDCIQSNGEGEYLIQGLLGGSIRLIYTYVEPDSWCVPLGADAWNTSLHVQRRTFGFSSGASRVVKSWVLYNPLVNAKVRTAREIRTCVSIAKHSYQYYD